MTDLIFDDAPPETWAEWEPELRRVLWQKRDSLSGTNLASILKALSDLVRIENERARAEVAEERRPVLERLDALPPDHAATLLDREIAETSRYLHELKAAREKL